MTDPQQPVGAPVTPPGPWPAFTPPYGAPMPAAGGDASGAAGYYWLPVTAIPPHGAYPFPPGWSPAPPARKRRGPIVAVISIIAVIVLAVCTGGVVLAGHYLTKATTAAANSPTGPTVGASPALTTGARLYAKIVKPPFNSKDYNLAQSPDGTFTAQQLTKQDFTNPAAEEAQLIAEGFVVAAGRSYLRPDGISITVYLLRFVTPSGASSSDNRLVGGRQADKTVTGTFAVPGGRGFEWDTLNNVGYRRSQMYTTVGDVEIILDVYTSGGISVSGDRRFLAAQVSALN